MPDNFPSEARDCREADLCKADKQIAAMWLSQPLRVHARWALQHSADAPTLEHNCMRRAGKHGRTIHQGRIHAEGSLPCSACSHAVIIEQQLPHQFPTCSVQHAWQLTSDAGQPHQAKQECTVVTKTAEHDQAQQDPPSKCTHFGTGTGEAARCHLQQTTGLGWCASRLGEAPSPRPHASHSPSAASALPGRLQAAALQLPKQPAWSQLHE